MKRFSPFLAAGAALCTALLLAACGGGGGGDEAPVEDPTLVPASATASVSAWFKFVGALMASDTAEPLQLTRVGELPTSEIEEPSALP